MSISSQSAQSPPGTGLRQLVALYHPDQRNLWFALGFFILKSVPIWILPLVTAAIVDIVSTPTQHPFGAIVVWGVICAAIIAQNLLTHYLYVRFLSTATHTMEMRLRTSLVRQLQLLSMHYFHQHETGALQAKLVRDVEKIEELTKLLFNGVVMAVLGISIALAITAVTVPWFLLFYVLVVPAALALFFRLRAPMERSNRSFRQEIENISATLNEALHLLPLTRAHGVEQDQLAQIEEALREVRAAGIRLDGVGAIAESGAWVTFRLFDTLCLLTLGALAYTHTLAMTVGEVVLLTGFFRAITDAAVQLTTTLPQLGKGFASLQSVGELLHEDDLEVNEGKTIVRTVRGAFTFADVGFTYPHETLPALREVSLVVQPGETIAFVGASGSGKSTLINLIIGFLRPTTGHILLDNDDMQTLDLRSFRQHIAVVAQETLLFRGTIRENVQYGVTDADPAWIEQCLVDANVREFADRLPQGYDTVLGENGIRLSGGQRQRIAIARALVRDPHVLLLDEATSALDTASEVFIQEALARLMQGRTTFIVAHRLSTIRYAHRIVVLDGGRISEIGTHEELLARQGMYARLHQHNVSP